MSDPAPYLPPEILDYLIDHLHDEPEALKMCSLVSKSWVPRAREHLFYEIEFQYLAHVNACKRAFLDPTRSPAHHTRSLSVRFIESIFIADAEEGSWVKTFSNVVRLELRSNTKTWFNLKRYLALFYGFSPVVKSLRVFSMCSPPPQVFCLICSLPLLEDLAMVSTPAYPGDRDEIVPRLSPPLTGTLCIHRLLEYVVPRLLELPNGLHFHKLGCMARRPKELEWVAALVEVCSGTLEAVDIDCRIFAAPEDALPASIDFSRATKLKVAIFRFNAGYLKLVTATLRTIPPERINFRQVLIYAPSAFFDDSRPAGTGETMREETLSRWVDLDRVLIGLWESCGACTKVACPATIMVKVGQSLGVLLPEMTKRGAIEPVDEAREAFISFGPGFPKTVLSYNAVQALRLYPKPQQGMCP